MKHTNKILSAALALVAPAAWATPGQVLKLDLQPGKQRATLMISHTGQGHFRLFKSEKQGNVIIEAENLSLPPALTRLIDASASEGPVLQMTPYNSLHSGLPMAKLVLQLRGQADVTSTDIPGKFLVEISRKAGLDVGGIGGRSKFSGAQKQWSERDELKGRLSATQKSEEIAKKLIEVLSSPQDDKKYFGSKVTFEGKDVEVPDVFRLVGESSELNIIWDPDVEPQKTSLAVKDLPWDQLLDIIVQQKNYKATVMGNVVRIMTLDTFNKQAEAKKKEISLSDELEPVIMAVIPLGFSAAGDMKKLIEELIQEKSTPALGGAGGGASASSSASDKLSQDFKRGRIQVDDRTNSLIVTNTKDSIERMRRLIKELDVPVPQVLIDSKIVIASENFSRTVGASWKFQVTNERGTAGPIGAFNGQDSSLSGGGDAEVTQTAFAVSAGAGSSAFGWGFGSTGQAFLKTALALSEINGESKTVASPRVIVNNNQTAKITDGQTLSQIVQGGSGGSGQSKELKPVLQLSVKPQVTSHGSIQLKDLSVQKDSVTSFGATTASLDNKQLTTDVLVDSGSTLVLGGIYQMNSLTGEQGIPLLKDLPFIGQLFRVNTAQSSKSELMVFITPQVLDPEGGSQSL